MSFPMERQRVDFMIEVTGDSMQPNTMLVISLAVLSYITQVSYNGIDHMSLQHVNKDYSSND